MNTEQVNQNGDDEARTRKVNELWNVFQEKHKDFSTAFRTLFVAIFVGYIVLIVAENDVDDFNSVFFVENFAGRAVLIFFAFFVLSDLFQNLYSILKAEVHFEVVSANELKSLPKIKPPGSKFYKFVKFFFILKLASLVAPLILMFEYIWYVLGR